MRGVLLLVTLLCPVMEAGLHSLAPPWYETTHVKGMILLLVKMPEREVALW
jgi:hypothetical protein